MGVVVGVWCVAKESRFFFLLAKAKGQLSFLSVAHFVDCLVG
jgi:hypothetical protein